MPVYLLKKKLHIGINLRQPGEIPVISILYLEANDLNLLDALIQI